MLTVGLKAAREVYLMSPLDKNLANREQMLARLRAEIVGPDPAGKPVSQRQAGHDTGRSTDPADAGGRAGDRLAGPADEAIRCWHLVSAWATRTSSRDRADGLVPLTSPDLAPHGQQPDEELAARKGRHRMVDRRWQKRTSHSRQRLRPSAIGPSFSPILQQNQQDRRRIGQRRTHRSGANRRKSLRLVPPA